MLFYTKILLAVLNKTEFTICERVITFTFTFSHFADAFMQSDLQLGDILVLFTVILSNKVFNVMMTCEICHFVKIL